ncbi:hypothetical protein [Geodermatophilus sp. SYSU D00684]
MSLSPARTVDVRGPRPAARVPGRRAGAALVATPLDAATGSHSGGEPHLTVRRAHPGQTT